MAKKTLFTMVNLKFIIIVLLISILNGCYVLIPKRYFRNYTKALAKSQLANSNLNLKMAYVLEDEFFSAYYSKKYGQEIHSYFYLFLFENNLLAELELPFRTKNGELILTQEQYFKRVKEKVIDDTEDYNWTYFTIKDSTLVEYDVEHEVGNWNALNFGRVVKRKYLLVPEGMISMHSYRKYNSDTVALKKHVYRKVALGFKPDSTKSDIYCRLTYKPKGYRRVYSENSPVQFNPCTSTRPTKKLIKGKNEKN